MEIIFVLVSTGSLKKRVSSCRISVLLPTYIDVRSPKIGAYAHVHTHSKDTQELMDC